MNSEKKDISVVIVSWNVRDFLRKCLASLYRLTQGVGMEVFVVDNNSSDGTSAMVRAEFPQVYLIANDENLGFGRANNLALRKSSGRYVLLLNPDTELIDNSLKMMVEFMDTHPEAAALGCKLMFPDGSLQHSCRHFPSVFTDLMENMYLDAVFPRSRFFNRYKMGFWNHDYACEVDVPYGACLLVRRGLFEKIGLFDERFFMYYDEIDLCYRIKKAKGKIYFLPDIKVIHHGNRSYRQIVFQCDQWKCRSKILFFSKHYDRLGIAGLLFNLSVNTLIVWTALSASHYLFNRPRDIAYFKNNIRFIWGEHSKYLKKEKENAGGIPVIHS